jgi:hypothetical protein
MTPQEKLERVLELVRQRDEIDAELLELMGGEEEVEEQEVVAPKQKRPYKKSKAKKAARTVTCKKCGNAGHLAKTCPTSLGDTPEPAPAESPDRSNGRTMLDKPLRLTATEFADVCEQLGDGLSISIVGFNFGHVELDEIRKASISDSYQDYLRR